MPTSINNLPDSVLQCILTYLPLSTLQSHSTICSRWHRLASVINSNRTALWLVIGTGAIDLISEFHFPLLYEVQGDEEEARGGQPLVRPEFTDYSKLVVPALSSKSIAERLVMMFGGITRLSVTFHARFSQLECIALLIHKYSSRLVTLRLHIHYTDAAHYTRIKSTTSIIDLFQHINSCPLLRRLTFEFSSRIAIGWNTSLDFMPHLRHLEQFHFCSADHPSFLAEPLAKYAKTNHHLVAIGLGEDLYGFHDFKVVIRDDAELGRKFSHLKVWLSSEALQREERSGRYFPNLKTAIVYLPFVPRFLCIAEVVEDFTSMTGLLFLRINLAENLSKGRQPTNQLPSLRALSLGYNKHRISDLERFHLASIAPQLQLLELEFQYFRCRICGVDRDLTSADSAAAVDSCTREHLLKPLKRCTKLRRIDIRTQTTVRVWRPVEL